MKQPPQAGSICEVERVQQRMCFVFGKSRADVRASAPAPLITGQHGPGNEKSGRVTHLCNAETAIADQEGLSLARHIPSEKVTVDRSAASQILAVSSDRNVMWTILWLIRANWKSNVLPFHPDWCAEVGTGHLVDPYHP